MNYLCTICVLFMYYLCTIFVLLLYYFYTIFVERGGRLYTPAPLHSGRVVSIKYVRQLSQNRVERVGRVVLLM